MAAPYLLAIDQGTSSSRAIIFSAEGLIHSVFQRELKLHYPQPGWVEQDPRDILHDTVWALEHAASADVSVAQKIVAAGITNQRETTILWDRKTGEPLYNAIVWQDRRTSEFCATLRGDGVENEITQKTGLRLDPYFSATKIKWILDNVKDARQKAERGDVCFGTVDSFLLWHLTGGKIHATDATNASRTLLYNIIDQKWDKNLLNIFDIPENILPKVLNNISEFGQLKNGIFSQYIPIYSMVGDQQSALVGQGCITLGMMKSTYGTGCFALMNSGDKFQTSKHKLLTTIGYKIDGKVTYALEGSIFNAGTAIQFLRDNLGLFSKAEETEKIAASLPGNEGVYFVPAFTGLGAPYWNPEARGILCGLDRHTSKAHLVRAALEAQGYQTRDLMKAMEEDSGHKINTIRGDGGLVANRFMCQFLADITGRRIEIPKVSESTAWGAACLAGIGAGVFKNLEDATSRWHAQYTYMPSRPEAEVEALYSGWKNAVKKTY